MGDVWVRSWLSESRGKGCGWHLEGQARDDVICSVLQKKALKLITWRAHTDGEKKTSIDGSAFHIPFSQISEVILW